MRKEIIDNETVEMFEMTNRHSRKVREEKQKLSLERENKRIVESKENKSDLRIMFYVLIVVVLFSIVSGMLLRNINKDINKCIDSGNDKSYCEEYYRIG